VICLRLPASSRSWALATEDQTGPHQETLPQARCRKSSVNSSRNRQRGVQDSVEYKGCCASTRQWCTLSLP
jgi:hypothetical protein